MLSTLELLNEKLDDEYSGNFSQCDDHDIMYWLLPQYQTLLTMKCASGYKKNEQTNVYKLHLLYEISIFISRNVIR